MTIEIETPDGIVEFPDGTTDDVITAALRQHYGAPAPQPMQLSRFGGAAIPEAALQMGSAVIAEPLAGLYGLGAALMPGGQSGGDAVRSAREAMTYQPRTEEGRNLLPGLVNTVVENTPGFIKGPISAAAEGYQNLSDATADKFGPAAGAAMASLPTALAEAVPGGLALREVRQARRAADLPAPKQFADPLLDESGTVSTPPPPAAQPAPLSQVTPSAERYQELSKDIKSGDAEKIIPAVHPDVQILKDAEALGIDLNPSHYSTNRAYVDMEQSLKSRPGSLLNTVEEKAIIALGNRADDLIQDLGGVIDKSIIDSSIKDDFMTTMEDLNTQSDDLYNKVADAIPRATRVNPKSTQALIERQLIDLGGDESLLTSAEKSIQRLAKTNPTYAGIDRVRRDIGSAIGKKSGPFKDDDVGQLKQLYAALSEDQQNFAEAFGVGGEYKDAQALVKQRKALEDQAIDVFGREVSGSIIPKLRQAATNLTKGDVSKLSSLLESIPGNRRGDVAATLLNDLFTSGARKNAPLGQGFMNAYAGLNRNPAAKAEFFKYLPKDAESRFNMIGRVTTGLYRAKALENTSRSARDVIAAMDDGRMLSKLYGVGKKVAAAEGVTTAIGLPGAGAAGVVGSVLSKGATKATKAADDLLSSDEFRRAIRKHAGMDDDAKTNIEVTPEYKAWLAAQTPRIRGKVITMGLIPFLIGSSEEE